MPMKTRMTSFNKMRYCDTAMTYVQVFCTDLETKEDFYLIFTKSSKMFPRVCNISDKTKRRRCGPFEELIRYNEDDNNRVQIITDKEIRMKYSMYLI